MLSPLETGTTRGRRRERGRSRETGHSRGYLAPAGGAQRRRSQLAGLARRGRARPLHLIHGGALPDSARQERLGQGRTPAGAGMPTAMIGGPAEYGRGSRAAAPRLEAVSAGAAAPATGPCRIVGVRARKTGCGAVASKDASGGQRPGIGRCWPVISCCTRSSMGTGASRSGSWPWWRRPWGQRWRRRSPGSLSVSRTRSRRDHGERDSRQAAGDAGRLSCRACGEHRCPPS